MLFLETDAPRIKLYELVLCSLMVTALLWEERTAVGSDFVERILNSPNFALLVKSFLNCKLYFVASQ